jgi:ABC-type polysaccharide/polyol phosphate export permease
MTAASDLPGVTAPRPRTPRRLAAALRDLAEGALHWPQWLTLGNVDIRLRFRRTGLGPLWTTLSFAVLAVALGYVYGAVFREPFAAYLPFVVVGLFVWNFAATTLLEACGSFVDAAHVLKQLYVPRSALVYRTLWRNIVLLGCNAIAVAAVLAVCAAPLAPSAPVALAGLLLLCLNLAWLSLILALATARYRAVSRIVSTLLPIGMLVTPVIWRPVGPRLEAIAAANPLYHAIELVRGPLIGTTPAPAIWIAAALCALLGAGTALVVFAQARPRIPYWL